MNKGMKLIATLKNVKWNVEVYRDKDGLAVINRISPNPLKWKSPDLTPERWVAEQTKPEDWRLVK